MRIFLDANILFSAAKKDGAIRDLLARLWRARHTCCVDAYVIEEARRNLAARYPEAVDALDQLVARCDVARAQAPGTLDDDGVSLATKDRPVLAAAVALRCDALVSGDKTHFGPLWGRMVRGVTIRSPRSLAEALEI